jgi:ribose transport system permease protein
LAFGLLNGLFVTKMRIPSFIATLGTQGITLGLSLGMNNGYVIAELPQSFDFFGNGVFLSLPMPIWFVIATVLLSFFLLNFTRFGIYVYAIGGNEDALTLSGQPSWKYKAFAFGYAGLMAGVAAIVITSRTMTAQPTVGAGMEFEAFFATVLGGIFAGRGGMAEALLGVVFVLILRNGLNVTGVPTYIQLAIIGIVLLVGIIFSTLVDRKFRQ